MNLVTFSDNTIKSLNIQPNKFYLREADLCHPVEVAITKFQYHPSIITKIKILFLLYKVSDFSCAETNDI